MTTFCIGKQTTDSTVGRSEGPPYRRAQPAQPIATPLPHNAAWIVLEASRRSRTSPSLRTIHWLPVQQRIDYKVALLTFKVRSTSTLSYLRLLIQDREHGRNLRSTTTTLCQPSTTTTFAKRAYRCSAPAVWNSLPKTVINIVTLLQFLSLG